MLLLAAFAFAQASVSLASCTMERGQLAEVIAAQSAEPCECDDALIEDDPQHAVRCVAHCTADLQISHVATAIVRGAANAPVLTVSLAEIRLFAPTGLEAPPVGTPPPRILLHSFLI